VAGSGSELSVIFCFSCALHLYNRLSVCFCLYCIYCLWFLFLFCVTHTPVYTVCVLFLFCVTHTPCIYCLCMISILWRMHLYFLSVYYFYSVGIHLYFCIYCLCIILFCVTAHHGETILGGRYASRVVGGAAAPHVPASLRLIDDWLIDWLTIADWSIGFIHVDLIGWSIDWFDFLIDWLVEAMRVRGEPVGWCNHLTRACIATDAMRAR
jgi:hypothetical protein